MTSDGGVDTLQNQHDDLIQRFSLLQDHSDLNHGQRELAKAWKQVVIRAKERAEANLSIAFVAQVGRGKSTLVAAATGLHLDKQGTPQDWSVLPVGYGRTTLGETRISWEDRDDISLTVQPLSEERLRLELRLFAQDIWEDATRAAAESTGANNPTEELHELLRTWLVPNADNGREALNELAHDANSVQELERASLSGLRIAKRVLPVHRIVPDTAQGLADLQDILGKVMRGELENGPVPELVELRLPRAGTLNGVHSVIDTRGLEAGISGVSLNARPDVTRLLNDRDALVVVCSEYESAPDAVSKGVLEHLKKLRKPADQEGRAVGLIIVDRRAKPNKPSETSPCWSVTTAWERPVGWRPSPRPSVPSCPAWVLVSRRA